MFDIAPTELLVVALVALVVIGPKDLPRALRFVGKWMGKARGMARHFRSGLDTMMRESELEDLEKQWRQQNEDIMRQFPRVDEPQAKPNNAAVINDGADGSMPVISGPDAPAAPPKSDKLP